MAGNPPGILRGLLLAAVLGCLPATACPASAGEKGAEPSGRQPAPAVRLPFRFRAASAAGPTVTLAAVGDVLLGRGVGEAIARFGTRYPFAHVAGILSGADIAFGNLECPLSESGVPVRKPISFHPDVSFAECLTHAGFDVLSLANNHTLDLGRGGLVETIANLRRLGIRPCGAGGSRSEAEAPLVVTVGSIRVGFVAFCDFLPEGVVLLHDRPTIASAGEERVRPAVRAARLRADVVVASFHWGRERTRSLTRRQMDLAHAAVDAGADLVLGHHPHVLQRLEWVRGRALIAYSLGNFLFDQEGWPERESAILRCRLSRRGIVGAEVIPVRVKGCRPVLVPATEVAGIMRLLGLPESAGR